MASKTQKGIEPKMIGIILVAIVAVGLAAWQVSQAVSPSANDPSFKTKIQAPPDSARPPGFEKPMGSAESSDKTGAE